jgi:hypothetical protein
MTSTRHVPAFSGGGHAARRLPIVTAKFRQKSATSSVHFANIFARLSAADLMKLIIDRFGSSLRLSAPLCHTILIVHTPTGAPAVTIHAQADDPFRRWQMGNERAAALVDRRSVPRSM